MQGSQAAQYCKGYLIGCRSTELFGAPEQGGLSPNVPEDDGDGKLQGLEAR